MIGFTKKVCLSSQSLYLNKTSKSVHESLARFQIFAIDSLNDLIANDLAFWKEKLELMQLQTTCLNISTIESIAFSLYWYWHYFYMNKRDNIERKKETIHFISYITFYVLRVGFHKTDV